MSDCSLTLAAWNITKLDRWNRITLNQSGTLAWWNGTRYNITTESQPLIANPDVGGTGVLIGFVATGYICWLILLLYYLLEYKPDQHLPVYANPIDRELLSFLRKRTGNLSPRWGAGLEKCVLLLSDQQMVTGITILVTGYLQLNNDFPLYYWQITVWLAWFSSVSHLSTLSVLRNYLRAHPMLLALRLLMMSVLAVMLIVALLPTGSASWLDIPGEYTICYFRSLTASWNAPGLNVPGNAQSLAMSTVAILAIAYVTRFVKLFKRSSAYARLVLRIIPGRLVKQVLDALLWMTKLLGPKWSHWTIPLFHKPFLVGFVIARGICDLFESMLWEIIWFMYAILWATLRLFTLRCSKGQNISGDESSWGFGQWVATFQLAIPLFAIIELCYEAWMANNTQSKLSRPAVSRLEVSVQMLPRSVQDVAPEIGPPKDLSTVRPRPASMADAQSSSQPNVTTYDDNFYRYPWFYGLLTLLIFETVAYAVIVLSWAESPSDMTYFMESGLLTLAFTTAEFYVLPIYVYALLFLQTPESKSIAEWVIQRTCASKNIEVQKRTLAVFSIVLAVLFNFTMSMSFYYMQWSTT